MDIKNDAAKIICKIKFHAMYAQMTETETREREQKCESNAYKHILVSCMDPQSCPPYLTGKSTP